MIPMVPLRRVLGVAVVAALAWGCGSGQATPSSVASPATPPSATAAAGQSASPSTGGSPSAPAPSGSFNPTGLAVTLEPFVDGLDSPLAAVNAGDGSGRLFVVEQGGLIRIVKDGKLLPDTFLDISGEISSGGEQ